MRLWHCKLLPFLPRQQLVSQWRECVAITKAIHDNGTPNHILVNRIMDYPLNDFYRYCHYLVRVMYDRGYKPSKQALQKMDAYFSDLCPMQAIGFKQILEGWHNDRYLRECLYNLEEKAICGNMTADEWNMIYEAFNDFTDLWKGGEPE